MKFSVTICLTIISALGAAVAAQGCDTCGCYIPTDEVRPLYSSGWYAGLGEQFTYFGTDKLDGQTVPNPTGQYLASSITQLIGGYRLTPRFSLQLSIPIIYRRYQRPEGFEIQNGTVSGLGDMSLVGNFTLYRTPVQQPPAKSDPKGVAVAQAITNDYPDQPFFATVNLIGGLKFPTGNPSRIKEEFNEVEIPGAPESGVHGHDLALGSGSFDGIVGLVAYLRYHAFFFQADTQYAIRSTGAYDYRYANAFSYSGGPGYLFLNRGATRVGLQFVVSGETKGRDHFRGEIAEDTGINIVYCGPRLVLAHKEKLTAEITGDLPVYLHNTSFQTVPSFRIRAGVVVRF